jgi:transposase
MSVHNTLEDLRQAVRRFGRTYNEQWLIERHAYRTPTAAREHLLRERVDLKQRPEPEPSSASGLS